MEKYGRARLATDDNIIQVCWLTNARDTHSEFLIFIAFTQQQWLHHAHQYCAYMYIV